MEKILDSMDDIMYSLSNSMMCSGEDCHNIIKVTSPFSCIVCGMMLCKECGGICSHKCREKVEELKG